MWLIYLLIYSILWYILLHWAILLHLACLLFDFTLVIFLDLAIIARNFWYIRDLRLFCFIHHLIFKNRIFGSFIFERRFYNCLVICLFDWFYGITLYNEISLISFFNTLCFCLTYLFFFLQRRNNLDNFLLKFLLCQLVILYLFGLIFLYRFSHYISGLSPLVFIEFIEILWDIFFMFS